MPVTITEVEIKNEFRSESVDWLLANVGDKITIEIDFKVETFVVSSTENLFILNKTDGVIPPAVGTWWIGDEAARFVDFRVGDTVRFYHYGTMTNLGTGTIVEKLDDTLMRILGTPIAGLLDVTTAHTIISVTVPITAINYTWNFIENAGAVTFQSKVDGSIQEAIAKSVDASVVTPQDMEFTGNKSYQIGGITIEGVSLDDGSTDGVYTSKFKIIHQTFLTPFILAAQWNDLLSLTAPDYFFNNKCLKAIFDVDAMYQYTDPNRIQTVELTEVIGNTGWFNENFNTGITNYYIDSIVYKRPSTAVIDAIELVTTETSVEITVKNTVDSPFSFLNTKFTLNFCRVPDDETDYQLNGKTILQNFIFDRRLQVVGSPQLNGDNYGGIYQVLKDVKATFVSTSEILIECKIAMDANVVSTISDTDSHQYMLWVAIQKHTLDTNSADKVALLADADYFFEDTSDPTMVTITNSFLRHPFTNVDTEADSSIDMFPNDEVVGYSQFYLDRTGRLTDVILFKSAEIKLKAYNTSTFDEFTLESFKLDLSAMPVINNNQFVDFELSRQFHIPATEIRKIIKIKRRVDLDTGNLYYYDIKYPYLHRWEYWEKLAGVNGAFFDTGEPNNGFNHQWHRYTTLANWDFAYEVVIKATKNSVLQTYREQTLLGSNDYDSNPDWTPNEILSYEDDTNTLLGTSPKFILGYKATRIEASFTKVSGVPILADIRMVIWIEVYEEGGINGSRRISSVYEYDSDTWFVSTDASKKVIVSLLGNTITGKCLIDFTKIPLNKQKFKITARLYDVNPDTESKWFQDSNEFIYQDSNTYIFQDQ